MSFESEIGMAVNRATECAPDYENQAANLKKEIEEISIAKEMLLKLSKNSVAYRFSNITSLAELVGGIVLVEAEKKGHYESMLKRIEKE